MEFRWLVLLLSSSEKRATSGPADFTGGPHRKEDREEAPNWPPTTAGSRAASVGIANLSSEGRGRRRKRNDGERGRRKTRGPRRLGSIGGSSGCCGSCWFSDHLPVGV
ncbi:hypothetical protein KY284_005128 [Solanum tuberosum]|uniref:Uncharacterized protein n=1 Tax=Solanum tuberosum TaxID=4113 RepID=M1BIC3_SOLTU|nr:hypothetical protein KY284_005128 [Solanum tuberosum]